MQIHLHTRTKFISVIQETNMKTLRVIFRCTLVIFCVHAFLWVNSVPISKESDDEGSMSIKSHANAVHSWISKLPEHLQKGAEKMNAEWSRRAQARESKLTSDLESERENSQKKDHQLLQHSLLVELNAEIDRFLELYQWQISLTKAEETALSKINDESMRTRALLSMTCQHVINDLRAQPLIQELNNKIDSVLNENLAKCTPAERRKHTCDALVMLKLDRSAKINEMFMSGPQVKLIKLFPNDLWNEGITAFSNAHKTGVDFEGIQPYDVISAKNSTTTKSNCVKSR